MNLIIDIGNTRGKLAVFEKDSLVELVVFKKEKIILEIEKIISKFRILKTIVSSVANISDIDKEKIEKLLKPIFLNSETNVPFINLYKTPKTLGVDRIALASAAVIQYPKKNILVIDAGTCITYDFINDKKKYLGGAISPGIAMRYKALHKFTSKLPLLESKEISSFVGNNTKSSIHSGVVNGVCKELQGVIKQYKEEYQDLTVVLTGGDTNFLAKQLKSGIFAHPNFVLEGLQSILIHNSAND